MNNNKKEYLTECISEENYFNFHQAIYYTKANWANKKILIFGSGIMGIQFQYVLQQHDIWNFSYIDNNPEKWETKVNEYEVYPVEIIEGHIDEFYIFIAIEMYQECQKQLLNLDCKEHLNFYNLKNHTEHLLLEGFKNIKNTEILLMGDCTLSTVALTDCDKKAIKSLIKEQINCQSLDLNSFYMRTYYNLLLMSHSVNKALKTVILFLNLDIFADKYHLLPKSQHPYLLSQLKAYSKCTNPEIVHFVTEVRKRANQASFLDTTSPNRRANISSEKCEQNKRIHTRLNYLYQLDEESESIQYLKHFVEYCIQQSLRAYFVILPVNYEEGERLFPLDFCKRYDFIRNNISKYAKGTHIHLIDQSYLLTKHSFISIRSINEGIREEGRKKIVKDLMEHLSTNY